VKGMARKKINPILEKLKKQSEMYEGIVSEIKNQYREIPVGIPPDGMTVRIKFPDLEAEEKMNVAYSKSYGELLSDPNIKTEDELLTIMDERGVWTDKSDERIEALRERVRFFSGQILENSEKMTEAELDESCKKYDQASNELQELLTKRSTITDNSIEGRANEIKLKLQIVNCVFQVLEDGTEKRIWADLKEINTDSRRVILRRIVNECIAFWNGVPSNFLENSLGLEDGKKDTPSVKERVTRSSKSPSKSGALSD